jgi:DNA-binding PadR family transcriptional regulator
MESPDRPAPDALRTEMHCHFDMAPPRHFLYPALLLLLAEEPRHGYRLVDSLLRLGFGPVDRASIYRALGELENDALLHSWETSSTAGSARQVYGVTIEGMAMLGRWMDTISDERSALDHVLKRYDAHLNDRDQPPPMIMD